jgi:hypothetical protein
LQRNRTNISGISLNYEFTLLDPNLQNDCYLDWIELYSFAYLGYHEKAFLGKGVCDEENSSNKELTIDPSRMKLKAIDAYAGFGIRILLNKNLKWFNGIGIGGYQVLNSTKGLYYNANGIGLLIRTGISYQFAERNNANF